MHPQRSTSGMTLADHHAYLKWPRLIMFNINGALSITATALASRSLVNLAHDRKTLAAAVPGAVIHAQDAVAAGAILTTFAGLASLYTATLSTVITLRLHREETKTTIRVKEIIMAILATLLLAAAIVGTVIIVPRSAGVSAPRIPSAVLAQVVAASGKSLAYKDTLVYPAMIVTWVNFGTTVVSFVLAAMAARHVHKNGPANVPGGGHHTSDQYEKRQVEHVNGNGV